MEFGWTPEQGAFRESVIGFAQRELSHGLPQRDHDGVFDAAAWRKCAAFGIQGLLVDPTYGGSGADALTVTVAMEALGYACGEGGLLFSLNAHMWAVQHPIERFGTDEQKQRYLPGLVDGSLIGAHAMSEPDSGSDAFSLTTHAKPEDGGWRLSGTKMFVTNAPVADVFIVFATTDPPRGFFGVCAFLLDRDTPGLTIGAPLQKMGLRTSPMAEVFLDDCAIGSDALLGRPGGGMAIFTSSMERERSLILACTIGAMERMLEKSLAYAKERRQFGQPIGKNQSVANKIVDMKLRLETARLLLYRLAWSIDQGAKVDLDSALVKLYLAESYVASALDALQTHGGYGYMVDYEIERDVRDALGSRLYSGTSEIQRNLAARYMGL
jgi:alkylation response protein AidB-like acyl-CoA dehydrogenase